MGRVRVPILIAMGVWSDSGRQEILLWQLGESENTEEWGRFLEMQEARGIRGENS
ncbi:MAG: transposase [Anaerolineae bacterium]